MTSYQSHIASSPKPVGTPSRHSEKGLGLRLLFLLLAVFPSSICRAQSCAPSALYILANGEEADDASGGQSAPIKATFKANPQDYEGYSARYEWRIYETDDTTNMLVHRFDENIEYTFTHSGTFTVRLLATFTKGNDVVTYDSEEEGTSMAVGIAESRLEMPNAFSPNGDGHNDTYKAKSTYQSIVSFKATIFDRWGHKLYSWNDVAGEWDGKVNGKVVKDGVYFVNVVAKGADGHVYHIRKDVNVLTGYNEGSNGGTGGGGE